MDINLTGLFDDFYHTRFFVLICLSIFTLLFTLRLDNSLGISYWIVFTPLWIWKLTALVGLIVGTIIWFKMSSRRTRYDRDLFVQYKAMLISFLTNLILFLFELIVCDKLETNRAISWSICFIPLYVLSIVSIGTSIWSIRYDRSYEIELFCSLNILQFVFISLRLDSTITWSWILVLIPIWICMSIGFIVLLYIIILTIVLSRTNRRNNNNNILANGGNHNNAQHGGHKSKQKCSNVILYSLFLVSLLTFEILLINKLDYEMSSSNLIQHLQNIINLQNLQQSYPNSQLQLYSNHFSNLQSLNTNQQQHQSTSNSNTSKHSTLSFFYVSIPLYLSYFSLMCLSFNNHTGNVWWFGLRRDFCDIFLLICPIFKMYGNIQIKSLSTSKQDLRVPEQTSNNRSNETSLITFHNQNLGSSSINNNNYISLSLLDSSALPNMDVDVDLILSSNPSQSQTSLSRKQLKCLKRKYLKRNSNRLFLNQTTKKQNSTSQKKDFGDIVQLEMPD